MTIPILAWLALFALALGLLLSMLISALALLLETGARRWRPALLMLGLAAAAGALFLALALWIRPADACRLVFEKLTEVAPGDTGLAIAGGRLARYTIAGGRYQLVREASAQGPPTTREGRNSSSARSRMPAQAAQALAFIPPPSELRATRARFVRQTDGRVTLMVATAVGTPVTLSYTIPQYQAAPGGCEPPLVNPLPAHVDSTRVIAWRPMPNPYDGPAWRAAQLAGWLEPYVVRAKFIGRRTGADTMRCPLLPIGTTVAVQAKSEAGWCRCESNLVRGATP